MGYTIGGGQGWLGRAYGLSANNVEAFEVVTADSRLIRADKCAEPDLFWALRGGGGSFGIVSAVDLHLFRISEVYAGLLWWPAVRAREVLHAWRRLTHANPPDEFTTVARLMRFPALPDVPEPVRSRSLVVVDVIHLGAPDEADALLRPLRYLTPELDTVTKISMPALARLHMDPDKPTASVGDGITLAALPPEAIDRVVDVFGRPAAAPLMSVELRQIGGEMARDRPGNGALAAVDAAYALSALGLAGTPAERLSATAGVAAVTSAMAPWTARQLYLNLAETCTDPARFWTASAYQRLRQIKARVDPDDLIRSNHPIPPAT